jgi:maltose alpha-D-glucosyltransferase/alpha-amylase
MKRIIGIRQRLTPLKVGTLQILSSGNHSVLAFVRRTAEESILVVANLSRFVQPAALELAEFAGRRPIEVIGRAEFPCIGSPPYFLSLGPHSFYWFDLKAC